MNEGLLGYFSREGYMRFKNEQQDQMYDPSEANTYKKWLEYEYCFANQEERIIIDYYLKDIDYYLGDENI